MAAMPNLIQKPGQLPTLILLWVILLLFAQLYVQNHQVMGEIPMKSWNIRPSDKEHVPLYGGPKDMLKPPKPGSLLGAPSTKFIPQTLQIANKVEPLNTGSEQTLSNPMDEQESQNAEHVRVLGNSATLPEEEYIALCIAIKDQHDDLNEFLTHHYYHMNVSRFYIMDDRSNPLLSSYQDYAIPRSALTFNHYEDKASTLMPGRMQWWIYEECINLYKDRHTWMGFIDVDEFLEIKTDETLDGILRGLEKDPHIGALSINWNTHTSSGLLERPDSVRQSFVHCIDENLDRERGESSINRHVKSFVKTRLFDGLYSPHIFILKDDAISVGEDEKPFQPGIGWREPVTRDRMALHHYAVKSRDEFQEKLLRWVKDAPIRSWEFWDDLHTGKPTFCPEMTRYLP